MEDAAIDEILALRAVLCLITVKMGSFNPFPNRWESFHHRNCQVVNEPPHTGPILLVLPGAYRFEGGQDEASENIGRKMEWETYK